jgi:phosphoribosyl 1,2-cyclic phosphate phosphodiesterase
MPGGNVLVDTAPELRLQLLRERIRIINAIAYTHYHADHLFGLDDARLFPKYHGGPVPVFCEDAVEQVIRRVFDYAFDTRAHKIPTGGVPKLEFQSIQPGLAFDLLGERVLPIRLIHGRFDVLGFRVGDMAYCTDVSSIPEESWPMLESLDILVLDALRYDPHPTHFCLSEALEVIERLKPKVAYLTHLSHAFDHASVESTLPPRVRLAHDGLRLSF